MDRTIAGSVQLRRLGRFRFPTEELLAGSESAAQLGRDGSLRIFFGPGRRVRLADGTEWRIKAGTSGRFITPMIVADEGKVAVSGPLYAKQSYGINGRDYGMTVVPQDRVGLRRPRLWVIRQHETDIASIDFFDHTAELDQPIPISAVIMAFTLITHGIPGEAELAPSSD